MVLAFADEASQQRVMRRKMLPLTPNTMTGPAELAARLKLIRARLYDGAGGEVTFGINALCCPIFGMNNVVLGTLGILGERRSHVTAPNPTMLQHVQTAAAAPSARMNGDAYEHTLAAHRKKGTKRDDGPRSSRCWPASRLPLACPTASKTRQSQTAVGMS